MTKATRDGVYTLGESRFLMRAGHELPPGAVVEPTAEESEAEETRKGPAPENASKGSAPETKAKR